MATDVKLKSVRYLLRLHYTVKYFWLKHTTLAASSLFVKYHMNHRMNFRESQMYIYSWIPFPVKPNQDGCHIWLVISSWRGTAVCLLALLTCFNRNRKPRQTEQSVLCCWLLLSTEQTWKLYQTSYVTL